MQNHKNPVATEGGVVATGFKTSTDWKINQNAKSSQPKTAPGTALAAFLKRYRRDLLSLTPDRHISQLLSCVDCLLDEVDRQGVTHG